MRGVNLFLKKKSESIRELSISLENAASICEFCGCKILAHRFTRLGKTLGPYSRVIFIANTFPFAEISRNFLFLK